MLGRHPVGAKVGHEHQPFSWPPLRELSLETLAMPRSESPGPIPDFLFTSNSRLSGALVTGFAASAMRQHAGADPSLTFGVRTGRAPTRTERNAILDLDWSTPARHRTVEGLQELPSEPADAGNGRPSGASPADFLASVLVQDAKGGLSFAEPRLPSARARTSDGLGSAMLEGLGADGRSTGKLRMRSARPQSDIAASSPRAELLHVTRLGDVLASALLEDEPVGPGGAGAPCPASRPPPGRSPAARRLRMRRMRELLEGSGSSSTLRCE